MERERRNDEGGESREGGRTLSEHILIHNLIISKIASKMSAFSFSFSGDDIEESTVDNEVHPVARSLAAETGTLRRASSSAFPIAGQPLLVPQSHDFESMLKDLPSNIAYSTLVVKLDDGEEIRIPRRELWDVRAQLMAEEDDEGLGNLGKDDVRTGVYEGGFKSWESSVDVVKVLNGRRDAILKGPGKFMEVWWTSDLCGLC